MVNRERLSDTFMSLVKIDSESRKEGAVAEDITKTLESLGATVKIDDAAEKVGGEVGNLVGKVAGNVDVPPLFLSGHMDTVGPGEGIKPSLVDGVFRSDGTTILGSDDKSAIAIIFEVLRILEEKNIPHGPLEIVLTVCEEIGLMGAKHFDFDLITAKYGYILDSTDTEGIVTRAPAANRFEVKLTGKSAHAGAKPENGISAIEVASKAISTLELGRIDEITTCNIGTIKGGVATNIVPEEVVIEGEVRSHDENKLKEVTDGILNAFTETAAKYREKSGEDLPKVDIDLETDFPSTNIPEDHTVVVMAKQAAEKMGISMESKTIGGGADANIFFQKGVVAGVLGTGMTDVHTLNESIKLDDMVRTTELLLEIINIHTNGNQG